MIIKESLFTICPLAPLVNKIITDVKRREVDHHPNLVREVQYACFSRELPDRRAGPRSPCACPGRSSPPQASLLSGHGDLAIRLALSSMYVAPCIGGRCQKTILQAPLCIKCPRRGGSRPAQCILSDRQDFA